MEERTEITIFCADENQDWKREIESKREGLLLFDGLIPSNFTLDHDVAKLINLNRLVSKQNPNVIPEGCFRITIKLEDVHPHWFQAVLDIIHKRNEEELRERLSHWNSKEKLEVIQGMGAIGIMLKSIEITEKIDTFLSKDVRVDSDLIQEATDVCSQCLFTKTLEKLKKIINFQ